jgi:DNA-binding TFAR19-related protein (PDSD5 family)
MVARKKAQPIEEMREAYDAKLREEIEKGLPRVKDRVDAMIDEGAREIIFAALGITKRWNEWEVDHCNGRKSAIANELGEQARKRIKEHFPAVLAEFAKPPKNIVATIRKEFAEQYEYQLIRLVRAQAESVAAEHAEELIKTFKREREQE